MTLNVGIEPFVTVEGITTTFNQLAKNALDGWNLVGVGVIQDHSFFSSTTADVAPQCIRDGVNVVAFSASKCGFEWGDTLGITSALIVAERTIEADVLFNANATWDAYRGPLRTSAGRRIQDFNRVALHEFGHVIGLDHVPDTVQSIMTVRASDIDELQADDIAGAHAVQFTGGPPPPTARVTLNGSEFRAGQTLMAGLEAQNPAGNATMDLYVGVLLPDGETAVFFSGGRIGAPLSLRSPASFPSLLTLATGAMANSPSFFQFTFPATGVAPGAYRFFAAVVPQGALADNRIDASDILGLDVQVLTFSP